MKHGVGMRLSLLVVSVWLSGCGSSVLEQSSYGASCSADGDCVAAFFGDVCQALCGCPNGAISKAAQAKYDADARAAVASCGPRPAVLCAPCVDRPVRCTSGRCALQN